jgi:hypothetical protein
MDWVGNRGHDVRLPYNYLSRKEWTAIFDRLGLYTLRWEPRLGIYPAPFGFIFDRSLHFVATVTKTPQTHAGPQVSTGAKSHALNAEPMA